MVAPYEMVIIESENQLNDLISHIHRTKRCAIDTETTGLFWALGHTAFIATFSPDEKVSYAVDWKHAVQRILTMMELNNLEFIFHNAVFDLHMLRAWTGWVPEKGYSSLRLHDTMYGFRILHPGHPASLKIASKRYARDADVDGPQQAVRSWLEGRKETKRVAGKVVVTEANWSEIPKNILLPYATQDTWLTMKSANGLFQEMDTRIRPDRLQGRLPTLREVYEQECRVVKVVAEMERAGFPVSIPHLTEGLARSTAEIDRLMLDWQNMGYADVSPTSHAQLSKLLYTVLGEPVRHETKSGNPSTGEFALRDMRNKHIGTLLMELRGWKKYRERLLEINSYLAPDSRVHASFKGDGARTGRFSCSDPALQNLSRPDPSKPYTMVRDIFRPPAGFEFLFMDFSQIELRLAAEYLQDHEMQQAFIDGVDFHSLTASRTYGVPINEVQKNQRALCKILNFSILYGAGKRRVTFALRYGAAGSDPLTREEAVHAITKLLTLLAQNTDMTDQAAILKTFPEEILDLSQAEIAVTTKQTKHGEYTERTYQSGIIRVLTAEEIETTLNDAALFGALAQILLDTYHRENPKVRVFTTRASNAAKANNCIYTAFGFEIPIPKERSHIAGNGIIQGSAAGLMKETLVRTEAVCRAYCLENGFEMWRDIQIVTTIHDEEGMLVPIGHARPLARALYPKMVQWLQFKTKIDVEFAMVSQGNSWAQKEDLKLKDLFA